MKKRFLKKLKKYSFVFLTFVSCVVIFALPVHAAGVTYIINNRYLNFTCSSMAIPGLNNAPDTNSTVIDTGPLQDIISTSNSFPYEYIGENTTKFYVNAEKIQDRMYFNSINSSTILEQYDYFEGRIQSFDFRWIVKHDNNYGFIYVNDLVNIDLIVYLRSAKSNVYTPVIPDNFSFGGDDLDTLSFIINEVPFDCNGFMLALEYNVNDPNLIDSRTGYTLGYYIDKNLVGNHQVWFIQSSFEFQHTPNPNKPLYSKPSNGNASKLEGLESDLIGSTNSAAQQEIDKSFNISFDLMQQWAYPLSAFRDAFNYFVNSHNAIYTVCIISLVIGVFLLFSNFVPRGRDR